MIEPKRIKCGQKCPYIRTQTGNPDVGSTFCLQCEYSPPNKLEKHYSKFFGEVGCFFTAKREYHIEQDRATYIFDKLKHKYEPRIVKLTFNKGYCTVIFTEIFRNFQR